jgi:hypothetical protein
MDIEREKRIYAIRRIANAIVETVRETGPGGAPESVLYMAMAEYGANMAQFNAMIDALIEVGQLERRGHLLVAK